MTDADDPHLTRRDALRGLAVAGAVAATTSPAHAQPATAPAVATPNPALTTAPTTAPATTRIAAWMSPDDVAVLDKLTGHTHDQATREQLARGLNGLKGALDNVRRQPAADGDPLAVTLDLYPPGVERPAPAGPSSCAVSSAEPIAVGDDLSALAFATVAELSRLLAAGRVTSAALTRMYLDRLKAIGPRLHCVVTLTEELALRQAERADAERAAGQVRGPLHGVPYGIKDLFATRGYPTTLGVEPYRDRVVDADATVVRKLEAAGAVLVAKLSLGELAMGDRWFGGLTRNPWKPETGSSGSSAGSCAAVAAGLVGFAVGTETLGSIVSPCVVCGAVGLRPTFGRASRDGAMTLCWTLDKAGPIGRCVEDCALVFAAMNGRVDDDRDASTRDVPFRWDGDDAGAKGLRIGFDPAAFGAIKRDTDERRVIAGAYDAALAKLAELGGAELVPVTLPPARDFTGVTGVIIDAESSAALADMRRRGDLAKLAQQEDGSWPNTFRVGGVVPAVDYLRAMQHRARLQVAVDRALRGVDCYATPPWGGPSLAYGNLCGLPALVLRCGRAADGTPVSIKLVGRLDRDDVLLRVGHAYERATDWHRPRPDL